MIAISIMCNNGLFSLILARVCGIYKKNNAAIYTKYRRNAIPYNVSKQPFPKGSEMEAL
jgi:hypothetical protein